MKIKKKKPLRKHGWALLTKVDLPPGQKSFDHAYSNALYQVGMKRVKVLWFDKERILYHLSCRRTDGKPVLWEDLQRIKNQLIGEECEGFELYPSEGRNAETDIHHLFVFETKSVRIPVGFGYEVPLG